LAYLPQIDPADVLRYCWTKGARYGQETRFSEQILACFERQKRFMRITLWLPSSKFKASALNVRERKMKKKRNPSVSKLIRAFEQDGFVVNPDSDVVEHEGKIGM
jgi:hypothetical protein